MRQIVRNREGNFAVRLIIILAGLAFIGAGCFILLGRTNISKNYKKAEGKIVGLEPHHMNLPTVEAERSKNKYAPIIEYVVDGKSYRVVTNEYKSARVIKPKVGRKVTIYYDPQRPERAFIASTTNFMIVGILFLSGVLLIYSALRYKPSS